MKMVAVAILAALIAAVIGLSVGLFVGSKVMPVSVEVLYHGRVLTEIPILPFKPVVGKEVLL